jgi:hypothetical protein
MDKLIDLITDRPLLSFGISAFVLGLLFILSHSQELMAIVHSKLNITPPKSRSRKKPPSLSKTMVVSMTLMGVGVALALLSGFLNEGFRPYKVEAKDWLGKWDIVMQENKQPISWSDSTNGEMDIKETEDKVLKAEILKAANLNFQLYPLDSYANLKASHRDYKSGETRSFEFFMSGEDKKTFIARYQDNTTSGGMWRLIIGRKKSF